MSVGVDIGCKWISVVRSRIEGGDEVGVAEGVERMGLRVKTGLVAHGRGGVEWWWWWWLRWVCW